MAYNDKGPRSQGCIHYVLEHMVVCHLQMSNVDTRVTNGISAAGKEELGCFGQASVMAVRSALGGHGLAISRKSSWAQVGGWRWQCERN